MRHPRVPRLLVAFALVVTAGAALVQAEAPESHEECGDAVPLVGATGAGGGPLAANGCTGLVRPGAVVQSSLGRCTLNWVADGSDERTYVGTAGHCAFLGERVHSTGIGAFGTLVARAANGPGDDWGWIRVDAAKEHLVVAELCQWGGPTRAEPAPPGGLALQYGWGAGYDADAASRARGFVAAQGVAAEWPLAEGGEAWEALESLEVADGGALTLLGRGAGGDSGSPLMSADGVPFGFLTHATNLRVSEPAEWPHAPAPAWPLGEPEGIPLMHGTTFARAVTAGEDALGVDLALRTTGAVVPLVG